ncbi:MAG TPA: Hpt domain-containing protein, partial [Candidatus Scybalousia intestinigallinarum]|nr:Hpt domain-containing protein [Candidatus Scybalousia intestinigallinarum]
KGIDVDKGLSLLGDEETYREMMMTFLQEIDQKQEKMKQFISDKNPTEYAVLAHSIKSDSKYFGFTKLADIAYQHELKGKENDIDFITQHQEEFFQEMDKIKEIIQPYLEEGKQ